MADNTFVNIGGHKVSAGIKYSTSEVKTGDVWIDGKPIYRKVFDFIAPATSGSNAYSFAHNISNLGTVVFAQGTVLDKYSNRRVFPSISAAGTNWIASFRIGESNIIYEQGADFASSVSGQTCYITIFYTKTTD